MWVAVEAQATSSRQATRAGSIEVRCTPDRDLGVVAWWVWEVHTRPASMKGDQGKPEGRQGKKEGQLFCV